MTRARRATRTGEAGELNEPIDPGAPMAPRRQAVIPPEETASPQTQDVLDEIDDSSERSPIAKIQRQNSMGIWAHLDTVGAAGIDETWIKSKYGGGQYRVYVYGTRGDKSWGYMKGMSKVYTIDDSIPFKGSLVDRSEPSHGPVMNGDGSPAGGKPSTVETMMNMGLMQMFNQINTTAQMQMTMMQDNSKALASMLAEKNAGGGGMAALLPIVAPLITELIKTMITRKDPVEIAQQLMAITGKPESAHTANVKDTLGALRELVEIREVIGGSGEPADPESRWISMAEKIIPGALELLQNRRPADPARPAPAFPPPRAVAALPAPVAPPASAVAPAAASSAPPGGSPAPTSPSPAELAPVAPAAEPDEWTAIEPQIAQLAGFARTNRDPHGVCMTVLTFAPDEMLASIRELVATEDALETLVKRFPVLAPHRAWTGQLLAEFQTEFFGEQEPDDPEITDEHPIQPTAGADAPTIPPPPEE